MAKDVMKWFRFYYEVAEDPKVQTLPARLFKLWVNLLCLAAKNKGVVPPIAQAAYTLRMGRARVDLDVAALKRHGLFDETPAGLVPHNWHQRQFLSDDVTARVKKHRDGVTGNVTEALHETPPDTETEQRTDSEAEDVA